MKLTRIIPVLICLLIVAVCQGETSLAKQDNVLVLSEGERALEDIVSMGGSVVIHGVAEKNVVALGGDIRITGRVEGDVVCLAGDIIIESGASVGGDSVACFGEVKKDAQAVIDGEIVSINMEQDRVRKLITDMSSEMGRLHMTPLFVAMRITGLLAWLLSSLLLTALFSKQIAVGIEKLDQSPGWVCLTGIVTFLLFVVLVLIFIILSFMLIGIPFLFLTLLSVFALKAFGLAVLFEYLGRKLTKLMNISNTSPYICILFGWLTMGALKFVPYFGAVTWFTASIFALGITVLTRFGTYRRASY